MFLPLSWADRGDVSDPGPTEEVLTLRGRVYNQVSPLLLHLICKYTESILDVEAGKGLHPPYRPDAGVGVRPVQRGDSPPAALQHQGQSRPAHTNINTPSRRFRSLVRMRKGEAKGTRALLLPLLVGRCNSTVLFTRVIGLDILKILDIIIPCYLNSPCVKICPLCLGSRIYRIYRIVQTQMVPVVLGYVTV